MRLETARLLVREWTDSPADLDRNYDTYRREEVTRWLGAATPLVNREQSPLLMDRRREYYAAHPGYGVWAVEVRATGVVAGSVLLKEMPIPSDGPGRGEIEIGWHLHPDSWGHGYATEAARAVLDHGWALGLTEIHAIARPDNAPSLSVMRRLGMTRVGRTDRWYDLDAEHYMITRPGW
ncbi:GNAT family N-acetyltransferase [Catellatospora bangladeshensis]|uniref:N-acetyltransferase n=1 Tax=Catellatospora bangladeshensis TaxID=310355 RepID=A0A8J3JZB3_9ACTN|nr:GNAT family N-acetyltransferase [Catellatospora bangladeshensis]GIF85749.1 N-acetyltransferase [Catellatospora bangladeshensis]